MFTVRRHSVVNTVAALAAAALLACASGTNAYAERQRAVQHPSPTPAGATQWQHDWSNGAVFYEIFVRSFQDSNGDGIGDLNGLTSKLDYLNDGNPATTTDLGIDAIWLMPVFESPSYHGYDTVDYRKIEKDYGTNADFQHFLEEAHRRGIRVIVDLVLNHTSNQNPWFIDSASSPTAAHRDWYVWNANDLGWTQPWGGTTDTWHPLNGAWYYGVFWSGMPDLNYRNPAVRQEAMDIAKFWLNAGVDGFRLDATRYMIETGGGPSGQADTAETHQLLKEFAATVRSVKPDATIVAENWTDTPIIAVYFGSTATIKGGDEIPMNFDFPLAGAVLDGISRADSGGIRSKIKEIQSVYPKGVIDAPFLTNHDQTRQATVFGDAQGKMRNAPAVLLTLPGAPFLYYGEEVGLQNGPSGNDEWKRTPMPWDNTAGGGFTTGTPWYSFAPGKDHENVAAETGNADSLLSRYRKLIAARHSSPALMTGDLQLLGDNAGPVLAFLRTTATERVLVVHNLSDNFVNAGPLAVTGSTFEPIFVDRSVSGPSGTSGAFTVALPPRTSGVWRVR